MSDPSYSFWPSTLFVHLFGVSQQAGGVYMTLAANVLHNGYGALAPDTVKSLSRLHGNALPPVLTELEHAGLVERHVNGFVEVKFPWLRGVYYPRQGATIPPALRRAVLERDEDRCVYCGSTDRVTVDHVVPVAAGGLTCLENLAAACSPCNTAKRDLPIAVFLARRRSA